MAIAARMDRLPLGRFHRKLIVVGGLGNSIRSMDVGLVAYILAGLIADWNLDPAQAGLLGSIGIVGMVLGVGGVGPLADRYGRKFMFEVATVVVTVFTGLCGLAWGLGSMLVFRFIGGIGMGATHPPLLTLVSELSPSYYRGRMVAYLEVFWVVGSVSASLIAYAVIPSWGWRAAFFLGAVPLLYLVASHLLLPESPRFLLNRGRGLEAEKVVAQIEKECGFESRCSPPPLLEEDSAPASRARLSELWQGEYARRTACVWTLWFVASYCYYGVFVWLPSLIVTAGYSVSDSFGFMLVITAAQFPGCLFAATLVDKIGRRRTVVPFMLLTGVACYLFGLSTDAASILIWGSLISFFFFVVRGVIAAMTAEFYPTRLRATGVGWSGAFGRIAGAIAPMTTGLIVAQTNGGLALVFLSFGLLSVLGGLSVIFLAEETAGRSLEELSK